jgi:hypothetical protein
VSETDGTSDGADELFVGWIGVGVGKDDGKGAVAFGIKIL